MFFNNFFLAHPPLPPPTQQQSNGNKLGSMLDFGPHPHKQGSSATAFKLLVNCLVSIYFAKTNQPSLFISFAARFATLWTFLRLMWPFQVVFTNSFITEIVFLYFILQFLGPRTFIDVIFVCFASLCSLVIWRRFRNEVSLWTWKPVWFVPLVHLIGTSLFVSLLGLFVSHL